MFLFLSLGPSFLLIFFIFSLFLDFSPSLFLLVFYYISRTFSVIFLVFFSFFFSVSILLILFHPLSLSKCFSLFISRLSQFHYLHLVLFNSPFLLFSGLLLFFLYFFFVSLPISLNYSFSI